MIKFNAFLKIDESNLIINKRFILPETEEKINFLNNSLVEITIKSSASKNVRSLEQLRLWFMIVEDILKHYGERPTVDNKDAMHEYLKEQYLPESTINICGKMIVKPKSISDLVEIPMDEFSYILNNIMTDFRKEGVHFRIDDNIKIGG